MATNAQDHLQLEQKSQERQTASSHQKCCCARSSADTYLLLWPEMLSSPRAGVGVPLEVPCVYWHTDRAGLCPLHDDL